MNESPLLRKLSKVTGIYLVEFVGYLIAANGLLNWYQGVERPKWALPPFLYGIFYLFIFTGPAIILFKNILESRFQWVSFFISAGTFILFNFLFFISHKPVLATVIVLVSAILGFGSTFIGSKKVTTANLWGLTLPLGELYLGAISFAVSRVYK